jgi:hypothetical protein
MRHLLFVVALAAGGCAGFPQHAVINDIATVGQTGPGYMVTKVDGKPVKRASNSDKTAVPVALVEPGQHELTLKLKGGGGPEVNISADIHAHCEYRITQDGGPPTLKLYQGFE